MRKNFKLDKYEKELDLYLEYCQKINHEKRIKEQLKIAAKKHLYKKTTLSKQGLHSYSKYAINF